MKPMSQAAIGRALGLAPATMTKLKHQGMPVDSVESARAWRNARQNIAARKPEPAALPAPVIVAREVTPDGFELDETHDAARTRREIAEANLAEMKESEQRGELIRVSAVEVVWAASLASVREHLMQVRARLAPLLAAESDMFKIDQLLDLEHTQALQLMAGARVAP